ncbi:MAG: hypothetical protein LWY06_16410 [Firmicutes bacterium]|nr:hypothetical protein [Bacillota bacterium]
MDSFQINPNRVRVMAVRSSTPAFAGERTQKAAESGPSDSVSIMGGGLFKSAAPKPKTDEAYMKVIRNDESIRKDGFDSSRDIRGVYAKEGKADEPYTFRVDLTHLRPNAELGNLDVYTLISLGDGRGESKLPDDIPGVTSQPWNLAVGKYDNKNFKAMDSKGNIRQEAVSGVKFDSNTNSVEFKLNKGALRDMGWKDGQPISLQAFTAKDFIHQVTDSLDEPGKKPWENGGKLTNFLDTANPQSLKPKRDDNFTDDVIYFVLTDRFEDGDPTNNSKVDKSDLKKWHGGDFQGLINKMDYIKELGVSTLWITPATESQEEFVDSAGYHGYWPVDFYKVDKHLGDMNKMKELVQTAHDKGIKVLLDVPLNHVAWGHPWRNDPSKADWFHKIGDIQNWNDPYQMENGSMYGLPDLAQENNEVYKYLVDNCKYWIDQTGIDGFRLDAVQHVPRWFWDKFSGDIKAHAGPDFYMVGEAFTGDANKIASYQNDGMPGLFDMPLYFTTKEVFANDGSMKWIAGKLEELNNTYDNPNAMGAIIDNHDTHRFLTSAGANGKEKMKLALSFLMTINRIPTIYYGTEQSMDGHQEEMGRFGPENRADMQFGKDPDMQAHFTKLATVRNNCAALREGNLLEMWRDDQVFAFDRYLPDEEAVVVLNNSYDNQYREIPMRAESNLKNGTVMKDALTGTEYTINDGKLKLNLQRKQPLVLVKK